MEVELRVLVIAMSGAAEPLMTDNYRVLTLSLEADAPFAIGDETAQIGAHTSLEMQQLFRNGRQMHYDLKDIYVNGTGELRIYALCTKAVD